MRTYAPRQAQAGHPGWNRADGPASGRAPQGTGLRPSQVPAVGEVLRSPGKVLDDSTRAAMEPAFGRDFGQVLIHADSRAALSAQAIGASAYTVGNHIVLGEGRHRPGTADWNHLVAHELTHVLQQHGPDQHGPDQHQHSGLLVEAPGDASEREAESVASSLVPGRPRAGRLTISPSSSPAIRRQSLTQPALTQAMYDSAVQLIAARDAVMAGYLRQAHVRQTPGHDTDRVRVEVRQLPGGKPGGMTTIVYVFELAVLGSGTAAGAVADYAARAEQANNGGTARLVVKLMTINLRPPAPGPDAAAVLADQLFHEGLHMMLDMDQMMARLEPGNTSMQTGAWAREKGFETRARADPGFPALQATIAGIIGRYPQAAAATAPAGSSASPAQNQAAATRVIDGVMQERFVIEQARAQMGGRESWSNTATVEYLRHYLAQEVTMPGAPDPSFQTAVTQLSAILNVLPTSPPPAPTGTGTVTPVPQGSSSGQPPPQPQR